MATVNKAKRIALQASMRKTIRFTRKLSFEKIIDNRIEQMKATPPKTRRWHERLSQLSLRKQINHYTIKFRTSWDEELSRLNVTGKLWVIVVASVPGIGEEIKVIRQFRRIPGFEVSLKYFLTALDLELKNRPSDSKGDFMELVVLDKRTTVWRSVRYDKNKEEKAMFANLPNKTRFDKQMRAFIKKKQHEWTYYQDVLRDRRGIKRYESDVRKTWNIEFPEKAVPVRS